MIFKYTNKYIKADCYVFIVSNKYKSDITSIEKNLNITFPKKIFENLTDECCEIKTIPFDKFSIILGGIGQLKNKCSIEDLNTTISKIGKMLVKESSKKIMVSSFNNDKNYIANQLENLILSMYKFDKYIDNKKNAPYIKKEIHFLCDTKHKIIVNNSISIGNITNVVRDIVNEPSNKTNSIYLETIVKKLFAKSNIQVKVLNESELKKKGLNLILGVNAGSKFPAKMIILTNKNKTAAKKSKIFIGKGVTFDAGGLNIKFDDFSDMKIDMTGVSIVIGLFMYINQANIKGNFVGMLPIVENMIDAKSIRPGDIITAYNKKTVEIVDTDAEGRLILADAISYSNIYNPEYIVDVATLTGSAANIFGDLAIVLFGNNTKLNKKMTDSSSLACEKIWELPIWNDYIKCTKSKIADYKNYSTDIKAGAIMGAAFLHNFIPKNVNWIHLDIAGVSYLANDSETLTNGATGYSLRTLINFIS